MTTSCFNSNHAKFYAEGPPKQVPGYDSLYPMISLLLEETVPHSGRLLVLGAGGGLEIKALAEAHSSWQFVGIDPSIDMLRVANTQTEFYADRVELHHGYIKDAPCGPFHAATALLTFHFIPHEQRLDTLIKIKDRLMKGAAFIAVHLSFPQSETERALWIARHVAYGFRSETSPDKVEQAKAAISSQLTILSPEEDVAMLEQAGFKTVRLFYAGLCLRGWIAYAD